MTDLHTRKTTTALALEFTILNAARTSETLKAEWTEINFTEKLWTIPAARMKSGREHRIPLNARSLEILKTLNTTKRSAFVFIGEGQKKPLPQMAMLKLLRRMKQGDLTVHGFRSSFKDWTRERTNFSNEVSEAALAHISGDKVERAYARGDLFEKRVKLMEAWAGYCAAPAASGEVVPINRQAAQ